MRIVTLTLSAAYDIHAYAEKMEVGLENFIDRYETDIGGKGINISRALASYGVPSTAVIVLGKDNSAEFLSKLEALGLTYEKILIPGKTRENITVHTNNGEETRISFSGTDAPQDLIAKVERITDSILSDGDILTFTGSIPKGAQIEEAKAFIKRLKTRGVKVIVDSRSFLFSDIIDIKPFLIKPNEYEVQDYIGISLSEESEARLAAEELRSFGVENVMITLGKRGAVLASEEGSFYEPAPSIEALSTIGAGDSSIAGFIYAISHGCEGREALRISVAFGTAACLLNGTAPPRKSDVLKILGNGSFDIEE